MSITMLQLSIPRKLLAAIVYIAALLLNICEVGAIGYPVLHDEVLTIGVANSGYTRFSFSDEKINDAFIYPEHLAETIIHKSGFMLLLPSSSVKSLGSKAILYLTLIGENGTTQDIMLKFNKDSPNPVRLVKFSLDNEINSNIN